MRFRLNLRSRQTGNTERKALFSMNRRRVLYKLVIPVLLLIIGFGGTGFIAANTQTLYQVWLDNEMLGNVDDPSVVRDWIEQKVNAFKASYQDLDVVTNEDKIRFESVRVFNGRSEKERVLAALEKSFRIQVVGVEVIVNGQVIGLVKDKETAEAVLTEIKEKYNPANQQVSSLSAQEDERNTGKTVLKSLEFVQEVKLKPIEATPDDIMNKEELRRKLETGDVQPVKYTVQEGDCISCIAKKFNIGQDVIYRNNPWIENDFLQIGDVLDLTEVQPVLSVKSVETRTETFEIPYGTIYIKDDSMRAGTSKVIEPGKPGRKTVTYQITKINGDITEEVPINDTIEEHPVARVIKQGTKVIPGIGTGSFDWPIVNPRMTSEFGRRWGKFHAGADTVSSDLTIRAADNGKVVFAGWNGGYGKCVIIDHQNGYKTLYAHMSKIETSVGRFVEKGEKIGVMGSTGKSTGVHLHFEIQKNGKQENPLKYLSN